jgi:hypothetical protein
MPTTADFLNYAQWVGTTTLACAALTVLAFILKWGIRFRLVGVTGFLGVVTGGLFALGLVPLTRTVVTGAVRFSVVYDNGGTQAVIAVPPQISESELSATLRQAAGNLYSFGRLGRGDEDQLIIRARTIVHPEKGVSQPLYLGQVKRSLSSRNDDQMAIEIYQEKLAQLPKSAA